MTRIQFEAKAIRAAERQIEVPAGWYGTWRDVRSSSGWRVKYAVGGMWLLYKPNGTLASRHDSRRVAIRKVS